MKFEKGHTPNNKGKTLDELYSPEKVEEIRERISKATKGRVSGNKGKKYPYKSRPSRKKGKVINTCSNPTENLNCSGVIKSRGKLCQSCSLIGHIPWNKGLTKEDAPFLVVPKERRKKISAGGMGRRVSEATKAKIAKSNRIAMKKRIEAGDKIAVPFIGKHESPFLDKIEKLLGYEIKRQYSIVGYWLDGYCEELNMAVEIDEKHHLKQAEYDKRREGEIKGELGCRFLRIPLYDKVV